ncbi:uncharacterized protein [Triticum aestivum]|uniref:uncharacterized protein n=1 Tax=Triticum aestivum TaxID=4565 RepID=UPI001D0185F5|nr:uncharacterized protein LOC123078339 [Triticum aestivum]
MYRHGSVCRGHAQCRALHIAASVLARTACVVQLHPVAAVGVLASAVSCVVGRLKGVQSGEPDGVLLQIVPIEHAHRCRLATVLRPGSIKLPQPGLTAPVCVVHYTAGGIEEEGWLAEDLNKISPKTQFCKRPYSNSPNRAGSARPPRRSAWATRGETSLVAGGHLSCAPLRRYRWPHRGGGSPLPPKVARGDPAADAWCRVVGVVPVATSPVLEGEGRGARWGRVAVWCREACSPAPGRGARGRSLSAADLAGALDPGLRPAVGVRAAFPGVARGGRAVCGCSGGVAAGPGRWSSHFSLSCHIQVRGG